MDGGSYSTIVLDGVVVTNCGKFGPGYLGGPHNNTMIITNGAIVTTSVGYMGNNSALYVHAGSYLKSGAGNLGCSGGTNNYMIVNGGTCTNTGAISVQGAGTSASLGSGNFLIVTNGGVVTPAGLAIGNGYSNNIATVTGAGSLLYVASGGFSMGVANLGNANNNQLNVLNGAKVFFNNQYASSFTVGYQTNNNVNFNNVVQVSGAGSCMSIIGPSYQPYVGANCHSNGVLISNGGAVTSAAPLAVSGGFAVGSYVTNVALPVIPIGNYISIDGAGSKWDMGAGGISLPYLGGNSNYISISNGGLLKSATNTANHGLVIGSTNGAPSIGNSCVITSGGTLQLYGGGTTNLLVNNTSSGNCCTNYQGIYEFGGKSNISVVSASPCGIYLNNGTISFINTTGALADVFCNQPGGLLTNNVNMNFIGNNTFRLNGCTNRSNIGQNYTFDSIYGATNFAGLALVNGSTMYTNGTVTIGAGGSMLFSNTTATIASNFTCAGVLTVVDSTVTFGKDVTLQENFTLNWSTNAALSTAATVLGTLTLPAHATVHAANVLGDVKAVVPIFTQPGGSIVGSPSGWTVDKFGFEVGRLGNQIVLRRSGMLRCTTIILQ